MRKYRLVAKKGEGTFSEVLKAQNVKDGRYHAIKCMKNRFESIDQVNNLREIQALRRLSPHEHIISLEEVLYDQPTGRLALVFELMDANLYEMIKGRRHYLAPAQIKGYMWQIMKSLDHMHRKGIFHRDIKPENILVDANSDPNRGLKLADFGSCRGIYSKQPYTEYISTRWYRAPECLLTDGYYGPEMDMWGAGCVMFEITSLYPLFPGSNEVDQISRIHKVLGTPAADVLQRFRSKGASHITFDFPPQKGIGIPQLIPHASPDAIDLIVKLIKYDATERISARETMRHPYFREHRELEMRRTQGESTKQASTAGSALPSTTGGDGVVSLASTRTSKQNRSIDAITQSSTASTNNNSSNYNTTGSNSNNNNDFVNQPPVLVGSSLNVGKSVPAMNDTSTKSGGSIMVGLAQKSDSNGQGQGQVAIGSKAALPSIVAANNTTSTFDSQLVRQPPQNHALSLTADLQQQMNTSQPKMPPININNTSGNVTNSSMLPPIVSGGGGIQQQQQQQLLLAGGGANGGFQSGRSQKASAVSANTTSSSTAAGAAAAAAKKRKKYRMSGVGGVGNNVQQQMNSSEQQQQQQQQQQQSQGLKAFGLSKASIGVTAMGGAAGGDMKGGGEYKSSNHYGAQGRQQPLASKKL